MEIIKLMVPMALLLGVVFLGAFFWTIKSGQMDELDSPATRILLDEEEGKSK